MVKTLSFFKRRAGMPVDEFQAYWRTRHPDVVTKLPGVRRYVQSHPRSSAYDRGRELGWDGIALIWFDDAEALRAATSTPGWAQVRADETNFVEPEPTAFIVTTEHVIVG